MDRFDARSLTPDNQEDIRRRAVKAVLDGKTQCDAAKIFGVTRQAVGHWIKKYKQGGDRAIESRRKGRPRRGALFSWQASLIARMIINRHPEQLKLPFYLWTREALRSLIERGFGIRLSICTIGRYMTGWGFVSQKKRRHFLNIKNKEVRRWIEEEYPGICRLAKRVRAEIFWAERITPHSEHAVESYDSVHVEMPVISATGQVAGVNMISAINNRGRLYFMTYRQGYCVGVFINFLRRLVRQVNRTVFLIVDRHSARHSEELREWLEDNTSRIRLFFLPSYRSEPFMSQIIDPGLITKKFGYNANINRIS